MAFNIRGIGGSPKRVLFKRLVEMVNPRVVLLQETMVSWVKDCDLFMNIFAMWNCCGIDVSGDNDGLLVSWNLVVVDFMPFSTIVGIMI